MLSSWQVATLTEQLVTAKAKTDAAEEKVLAVAAAAAQMAVEEQEKAEQRMSEITPTSGAAVRVPQKAEASGGGEEEDRTKKSKQKQMTLDSMLPKHAARARQLEEAVANSTEDLGSANVAETATADREKQSQQEEADWCAMPLASSWPCSLSCIHLGAGVTRPQLNCAALSNLHRMQGHDRCGRGASRRSCRGTGGCRGGGCGGRDWWARPLPLSRIPCPAFRDATNMPRREEQ